MNPVQWGECNGFCPGEYTGGPTTTTTTTPSGPTTTAGPTTSPGPTVTPDPGSCGVRYKQTK